MNTKSEICKHDKKEVVQPTVETQSPVVKPAYSSRYDEEAWEVSVTLPGVKREDVDVTVENEILDIKARRHFDLPDKWRQLGENHSDRRYRLRLDVGPEVDPSGISAGLESGILTLRLPLREESRPRSIEVK